MEKIESCKENKWASAIVDCISHLPDANFWKYSLQLNTYKWILEKNYGKKISNMFLVWLHPNNPGNSYLRYEVDSLPKEMEDLVKLRMRHTLTLVKFQTHLLTPLP